MIKIASKVYEEVEVTLQDDTEVLLRPLPIGRLRRFMKAWEQFENLENEDQSFDVFIDCAGISLENSFKGQFESLRGSEGFLSDEYKEYLEDVLDLETIYKIIEVCGGIDLKDPKLIQALENQATAEGGRN